MLIAPIIIITTIIIILILTSSFEHQEQSAILKYSNNSTKPNQMPMNKMSRLNCLFEDSLLPIKTDEMWVSRVAKEAHDDEVHCFRVIFHHGGQTRYYEFRDHDVIINLSRGQIITSNVPVVQPWFGGRASFRKHFDIVSSPFYTDSNTQLYSILQKNGNMQVALPIEFKELLPILYIEDYANTTLLSYDDLNATMSINFVVILDLSHLMIYHLMKTLRIGAIAIIVVEQGVQGELYLPFSEVLDWKKAVILTTMTDLQNLLDNFLTKLPFHTLHRMCRQGYRQIFCSFLLWLINWLYCTNTRQAACRLPAFCLNCIHMKRATE